MATQFFSVKLSSGQLMPVLGLGTWKSKPGEVAAAVKTAIDVGYRHIDAAYCYQNEKEVGDGIKAKIDSGTVKREDLFVTTKLWNKFHEVEDVVPILKKQLSDLQLDYVDLFLFHWPYGFAKGDAVVPRDANGNVLYDYTHYCDTWKAMEECVDAGLTKSIGLANFNSKQVQEILDTCRIKPIVNQIECHAYLNQSKLIEFCKARDITVTAYSPLGSPDRPWASNEEPVLLEDPVVKTLAEKYNKSPAQILLRWLIQRDLIVIPKSVTPARIQSNLELFDFTISGDDMKIINNLDRNLRYVVPIITVDGKRVWRDAHHPYFPFNEPF